MNRRDTAESLGRLVYERTRANDFWSPVRASGHRVIGFVVPRQTFRQLNRHLLRIDD
jgi:hypothetical protein